MHFGDNRHGGSERDGDLESDGYSSVTDYPSEDGEVQQLLSQLLAPSDGSDGAAQGGTTALVNPPTSAAAAERSPSPRLLIVLARMGLSVSMASSAGIFSCEAALEASDDAFGEYSEDLRVLAGDELSRRRPREHVAAAPASAPSGAFLAQFGGCAAVPGPSGSSIATSGFPLHSATEYATAAITTVAPGAGLEQASSARTSVAAAAALVSAANLAPEERAIELAIDHLFASAPVGMLFPTTSAAPLEQRYILKREHLRGLSASQIGSGTLFISRWVAFCRRHSLPISGAPIDTDTFCWFLSEVDAEARSKGHTSLKHSTACTARFLATHAGMVQFNIAMEKPVRAQSRPNTESEPGWAQMWEVSVLVHFFRIAVLYDGPGSREVRVYALAFYFVCAASLRMIDGLRSAPPVLGFTSDGLHCVRSVSALTKGKRRSKMAPMPWIAPLTSPDSSITDAEFARSVGEILSFYPPGASSMFPLLVSTNGFGCSLAKAVGLSQQRSTHPRVATAAASLLQWQPLSLSPREARCIAAKQHGPRHLMPEVSRVVLMPEPARDELGYWKDKKGTGRLRGLSNRYSREGEEVLQVALRSWLLLWIRRRLIGFRRVALSFFACDPFDSSASAMATAALAAAAAAS